MELYRKYRPATLDEIYGNNNVKQQLKAILARKDKPHTYLFVGPPGCGKTTLAYIMAKELGIATIIEQNSADFRGIDSARELAEQIQFIPLHGTQGFILEEFHQQTKDAQEALLKITENCPEHTYFFFTTTDASKINAALKTRMVIIQVQALEQNIIEELVKSVLVKENINLTDEVITHVAKSAYGSPRRALTMLEKVIGLSEEEQLQVAGYADEAETAAINLCRLIVKGNQSWGNIADVIKGLKTEPEPVRRAVLGYLRSIMLSKDSPKAWVIAKHFEKNYYESGNMGLVMSCYGAWFECKEL